MLLALSVSDLCQLMNSTGNEGVVLRVCNHGRQAASYFWRKIFRRNKTTWKQCLCQVYAMPQQNA